MASLRWRRVTPQTAGWPVGMGLLDRPVSVRIEKADFLIVAHLHTVAAGRAGIVAYGFEPTALLFLLVAAVRAWVTEENIQ